MKSDAHRILKLSCKISALIGYAQSADALFMADEEGLKRWSVGIEQHAKDATEALDEIITIAMRDEP